MPGWIHRTCPDTRECFRSQTRRPGSLLLRPKLGLQNISGGILQVMRKRHGFGWVACRIPKKRGPCQMHR